MKRDIPTIRILRILSGVKTKSKTQNRRKETDSTYNYKRQTRTRKKDKESVYRFGTVVRQLSS